MKTVIILRGVPGAGKSVIAEHLCSNTGTAMVCADDFFTHQDGSYHFDLKLLGRAHADCQYRFTLFLHSENIDTIIVANTNTLPAQWEFYENAAKEVGARVIFLVVENRHNGTDSHLLPEETLVRKEDEIRNNLKLR